MSSIPNKLTTEIADLAQSLLDLPSNEQIWQTDMLPGNKVAVWPGQHADIDLLRKPLRAPIYRNTMSLLMAYDLEGGGPIEFSTAMAFSKRSGNIEEVRRHAGESGRRELMKSRFVQQFWGLLRPRLEDYEILRDELKAGQEFFA